MALTIHPVVISRLAMGTGRWTYLRDYDLPLAFLFSFLFSY